MVAACPAGVRVALVLAAWILLPGPASAQEFAASAPDAGATLLRENDFVAIWDVARVPDPAARRPLEQLTK